MADGGNLSPQDATGPDLALHSALVNAVLRHMQNSPPEAVLAVCAHFLGQAMGMLVDAGVPEDQAIAICYMNIGQGIDTWQSSNMGDVKGIA